jgi:hypothetical protein
MFIKFFNHRSQVNSQPANLPMKIVKLAVAITILSGLLMVAAVLFVYIAIGTVLVISYLWWKTRGIRRQLKMAAAQAKAPASAAEGLIIEGVVIRESARKIPT